MKQRCIEDKAVRTEPEAFLHAIYSITGQKRPQPAHIEGGHILHLCLPEKSQRASAVCLF